MNSSFRIVRVRGIEIGANWSWLFVFALIIWQLATGIFPDVYPGLAESSYWVMGAVTGVLFIVSLLLHELGHAFRAQKEGMEIEGITLWVFGGVAKFKGNFPSAGAEFRIAIAGPLVTVVLGIVFGALWLGLSAAGAPDVITGVPNYLWQINVTLLVFNMIPALPLDGGRVLRSALWQRSGNFVRATRTAATIARMFAGAMIAVGSALFIFTADFNGIFLAFIGLFLIQASRAEEAYALFRQTLGGMRVRDLMTTSPQTVIPSRTIDSFINDVTHESGHSTYPVVDLNGELLGLASLRLAAGVPFERRGLTSIRDVMLPIGSFPTLSPDDEIGQVLPKLQQGPGRAVVMEDGRVVGLLSVSDVARAIELEQIRDPSARPSGRVSRRGMVVLFIVIALAFAGFAYSPPFVILAPGTAFDVTRDVRIKGTPTDAVDGQFLLTSVAVQQPKLFGLLGAMAEGKDVLPLEAVVPRNVDPEEYFEQQEKLFRESQMVAAAAAANAGRLRRQDHRRRRGRHRRPRWGPGGGVAEGRRRHHLRRRQARPDRRGRDPRDPCAPERLVVRDERRARRTDDLDARAQRGRHPPGRAGHRRVPGVQRLRRRPAVRDQLPEAEHRGAVRRAELRPRDLRPPLGAGCRRRTGRRHHRDDGPRRPHRSDRRHRREDRVGQAQGSGHLPRPRGGGRGREGGRASTSVEWGC